MSRPLVEHLLVATLDQVPVEFRLPAAIPGQEPAGRSATLDPVALEVLAQSDASPQEVESGSVAKLPVAKQSAAQLSREVAASLDQVGQGALASHGQVHQEASANLDQECQEASADYDQDVRRGELERQAHHYNTKFRRELMPYIFIQCFWVEVFHFLFRRIYQSCAGLRVRKPERLPTQKTWA